MITVIGAGALGSHTVLLLRNLKHVLKVVDFDRVEQKNTLAQFHFVQSVGHNKSQSLARGLMGFNVKIQAVPHRLMLDNAHNLLSQGKEWSDLVVDCTDNVAAREIIRSVCREYGIPCVHGALSADGSFGSVTWTEHFNPDPEGQGGEATCIDGQHLPFFSAVASYLAISVQQFLESGKKMGFHLTPTSVLRTT